MDAGLTQISSPSFLDFHSPKFVCEWASVAYCACVCFVSVFVCVRARVSVLCVRVCACSAEDGAIVVVGARTIIEELVVIKSTQGTLTIGEQCLLQVSSAG
jgi:hypothetical protein